MAEYYKQLSYNIDRDKIQDILKEMPRFCHDYYAARKLRLTAKTQLNYLLKMRVFLRYLHENNSYFGSKEIKEYSYSDMALLEKRDFIEFNLWLLDQKKFKQSKHRIETNSNSTVDNYLSCISSYFSFFVSEGELSKNPLKDVEHSKRSKKPIVYLHGDDLSDFITTSRTGEGLSDRMKMAWEKTALRDRCIIQIIIDTGIRVSELVGLDIDDIDFKKNHLKIARKGDKPDNAYFSDSTHYLIKEYLETREIYQPVTSERALFLVGIGKYKGERLSVRSVELIVKKFAKAAGVFNADKITPHKLRSTFAMNMLDKNVNLAVIQKQLGHSSILSTTSYVEASERDKENLRNVNSDFFE